MKLNRKFPRNPKPKIPNSTSAPERVEKFDLLPFKGFATCQEWMRKSEELTTLQNLDEPTHPRDPYRSSLRVPRKQTDPTFRDIVDRSFISPNLNNDPVRFGMRNGKDSSPFRSMMMMMMMEPSTRVWRRRSAPERNDDVWRVRTTPIIMAEIK